MSKFGWAYIGCGDIAFTTARELLKTDDNEIVAVWNRTRVKAEKFANRFGGNVYDTIEEAINAPGVEGVYIAVTADKHAEFMKLCIAHRKPVLCEKPFTVNAKEAEEVLAYAAQEGVYVSEAMWTWHNDTAKQVKTWMRSHAIGKVRQVNCDYSFPMIRFSNKARHSSPVMIGGALLDIGVYCIRYCYELFGMPQKIICDGRLSHGIDLGEMITLRYDGFDANLRISRDQNDGEKIEICGCKGKILVPMFHMARKAVLKGKTDERFKDTSLLYAKQFSNVANEIRSGAKVGIAITPQSTIDCMMIMDACRAQMGLIYPCEMKKTSTVEKAKIKAISHLGFNCKDLEKSIAFYRDIMGCTEKFTLTYGDIVNDLKRQCAEKGEKEPLYLKALRRFADKKWSVYMQWNDECFIELFYAMGASKQRIPGQKDLNYTHFALEVDDIRAFRTEIEANGGAPYIDTEITRGIENTWQFWMHDPDGNKFEIMEYSPESYQVVGRE